MSGKSYYLGRSLGELLVHGTLDPQPTYSLSNIFEIFLSHGTDEVLEPALVFEGCIPSHCILVSSVSSEDSWFTEEKIPACIGIAQDDSIGCLGGKTVQYSAVGNPVWACKTQGKGVIDTLGDDAQTREGKEEAFSPRILSPQRKNVPRIMRED